MTIIIVKEGLFFDILTSTNIDLKCEQEQKCIKCESLLSKEYSYIIIKLEEAMLLEKNFVPLCCFCFLVDKLVKSKKCKTCGSPLDYTSIWKKVNSYEVFCSKHPIRHNNWHVNL